MIEMKSTCFSLQWTYDLLMATLPRADFPSHATVRIGRILGGNWMAVAKDASPSWPPSSLLYAFWSWSWPGMIRVTIDAEKYMHILDWLIKNHSLYKDIQPPEYCPQPYNTAQWVENIILTTQMIVMKVWLKQRMLLKENVWHLPQKQLEHWKIKTFVFSLFKAKNLLYFLEMVILQK